MSPPETSPWRPLPNQIKEISICSLGKGIRPLCKSLILYPINSDDPGQEHWIIWSLTMNGSRTTVVRWSDETDQSQSCDIRDAAGVIQEEKDETRPLRCDADPRGIRSHPSLVLGSDQMNALSLINCIISVLKLMFIQAQASNWVIENRLRICLLVFVLPFCWVLTPTVFRLAIHLF